jgi:hypothetical protein
MNPSELIHRYFELAPGSDVEAYFELFAPNAVAEDEGHLYKGIDAIRAWRTTVPPVTYTVVTEAAEGEEHVAHAEIAGDFPGSPVTLAFRFTFDGAGLIQTLAIRT